MKELEQRVWAAAFSLALQHDVEFIGTYDAHRGIDDISGFSCAEQADFAVVKLREALQCADSECLYPVKERW